MTRLAADYVGLSTKVVKGFIVGEHGDSQIPIWSRLSIAGVPMNEYCENVGLRWSSAEQDEIAKGVQGMGAEIISEKGKTHYDIATCVCSLADAVLNQRLTIASVSTPLQGEYGVNGISLSVPSIIGVNGVEKRLEERWSDDVFCRFRESAEKLRTVIQSVSA